MFKQARSRQLIALGAVGALTLAACGDDSDDVPEAGGSEVGDPDESDDDGTGGSAVDDEAVTIEHAFGEATFESIPERIVVFDVGALLTIDELGFEAIGVPDTTFPESLSHYDDVETAGSLFDPDFEVVNALDPDLIIIGGRSATDENYDRLQDIAPTVDATVDNTDFIASFTEQTTMLGEIFRATDEVRAALAEINQGVTSVAEDADSAGTGLIVMTSAGEASAYGPGSRFGIIHEEFGITPASGDIDDSSHGDVISFEFILDTNPDTLYVLDRDAAIGEGGDAAHQVLDNELVAETTAWANDDVYYLDPFAWYIAPSGLSSVRTMISDIEASLGD